MTVVCEICGRKFSRKQSYIEKYKHITCSRVCSNEMKRRLGEQRLSDRVGCEISKWLYQKYVVELKTTRQIATILYNKPKSSSCVKGLLKRYNIPVRHGSEAIKIQWINADERRKATSKRARENLLSKEAIEKSRKAMKTPEYSRKQSLSKMGEKNGMYGVYGEKHPQWNPNRTHEQRVKERKTHFDKDWRKSVFERDGYACQCCGDSRGHNLVAHHLYSYDIHKDLRYDVDNGITLCECCHKAFHGIYGYGKNTKPQFNEFLNGYCPN